MEPLTRLTKKNTTFSWGQEQQAAFNLLKQLLLSSSVLCAPNPSLPYILYTDASDYAVGCALYQLDPTDGLLHPVEFWSQKYQTAEFNYSNNDKELLAIVASLSHFRHLLSGTKQPVTVRSDHRNLLHFTKKRSLTPRHAWWAVDLAEYNFVIEHTPKSQNVVADALSRRTDLQFTRAESQARHEQILLPPWTIDPTTSPVAHLSTFHTQPALQREVVTEEARKLEITRSRHDGLLAGHWGIAKTLDLVQRDFVWDGMWKYVEDYVSSCESCARNKAPRQKPFGELQPLPIPGRPWESISLDFIVKLPQSSGFDSILVVVDRLTKFCTLHPLQGDCHSTGHC